MDLTSGSVLAALSRGVVAGAYAPADSSIKGFMEWWFVGWAGV